MRNLVEYPKRINKACIPFMSLGTVLEIATEQKVYLFSSEFPSNCYSAFFYLRTLCCLFKFLWCKVREEGKHKITFTPDGC